MSQMLGDQKTAPVAEVVQTQPPAYDQAVTATVVHAQPMAPPMVVTCPPGNVTGLDQMCRPGPLAQGSGAGPWPGGDKRVWGLSIFNLLVLEDCLKSGYEICHTLLSRAESVENLIIRLQIVIEND